MLISAKITKNMLYNIKNALYLHCVFHGIRFKVNKKRLGCRETALLVLIPSHFFLIQFSF